MSRNIFKRGLAAALILALMNPVAVAQPITEYELSAEMVDPMVDELGEVSLGDCFDLTDEGTLEAPDEALAEPTIEPTQEPLVANTEAPDVLPDVDVAEWPEKAPTEDLFPMPTEPDANIGAGEVFEGTVLPGFTFPEDIPLPAVFLNAETECGHLNNRLTFVTFGDGKITDIKKYQSCDAQTHWAVGDVYRITRCMDCGGVVEKTLLAENARMKQYHVPGKKNTCARCNVKLTGQATTEVKQVYVPSSDMTRAVCDGNSQTHLWQGSLIERTYVNDPYVGVSYDAEKDVVIEENVQWREDHTMNGRYCTQCDYVSDSVCAHSHVEVRANFDQWPYSADTGDEFKHRYLGDWSEELYCLDCGESCTSHPETGESYPRWYYGDDVLQDHEYVNGVCNICGHKAAFALSDSSLKLGIGEKYTLGHAFENEAGDCLVSFASSKSSVASVNKNTGEITPKKAGTVTITVKAANGYTVKCKVTVGKKPTSIKLGKSEIVLGVGETFQMTAKLSSKSYSYIGWSVVAGEDVVFIDADGKVTALNEGTATICAKTYNGKTARGTVVVKTAPTDSDIGIALDKAVIGVKEVTYAHSGLAEECAGQLTYTVEGDAATVDVNGKIVGTAIGSAVVKVEAYNGASATAQLEVKAAPSQIRIVNGPGKMGVGQKYVLDVAIGADGEDCAGSWIFASSNQKVATVNKTTGQVVAKATGSVKITATSHHNSKIKHTITIKVYKKPSSVKIDMGLGKRDWALIPSDKSFKPKVKLSSGSHSPITWSITSENNCATVDAKGVVTPTAEGVAYLTATTYNGKHDTLKLNFEPLNDDGYGLGYRITNQYDGSKVRTLGVGEVRYLEAYSSVDWDVDLEMKASLDGDCLSLDPESGKIVALKPGTTTVNAYCYRGFVSSVTYSILPEPSKITIANQPKSQKLGVGDNGLIEVQLGEDGEICAGGFTFTSSNSSIVSVNKYTGQFKAQKPGKATITVTTYNNKTDSITIQVYKKAKTGKLNATSLKMGVGETFDLKVQFASGTYSKVSFNQSSSSGDCITVDKNGHIVAKEPGSATIKVSLDRGKSYTCNVSVGYAPECVDFGFDSMILHVGQKETFKATPLNRGGVAYGKVSYTSSNPSIATVSSSGKVTPKKAGMVTITAQAYAGEPASYELMVLPAVKSVKINIPSRIPVGSVYGLDVYSGYYTDFGIFDYIAVSPNTTGVTGISILSVTSVKSSNAKVADVGYLEEDGLPVLVAFKKGKFTLTVKTYNGKTARKTITVY